MSGFFGSSSILASIAGVMMGRVLVSETQWNQRWARTVVVWSPLLGMALTLIEARVSNAHVLGDDSSKRTAFWTMIMLGQAAAFFQTVPYVPLLATGQSVPASIFPNGLLLGFLICLLKELPAFWEPPCRILCSTVRGWGFLSAVDHRRHGCLPPSIRMLRSMTSWSAAPTCFKFLASGLFFK